MRDGPGGGHAEAGHRPLRLGQREHLFGGGLAGGDDHVPRLLPAVAELWSLGLLADGDAVSRLLSPKRPKPPKKPPLLSIDSSCMSSVPNARTDVAGLVNVLVFPVI